MSLSADELPGVLPRHALSAQQRDQMFGLFTQYFEGVTRRQFDRDLAEKNWVIELRRGGVLVGFSTLLATTTVFDGEPITVIYSGDTIVAPEAWGSSALARTWISAVNRRREEHPGRRCYWLLLTSGFRTYRFLPVFWREYFPRHDTATPQAATRLLSQLAREQYRDAFDPAAGVVRFATPQRLRRPLAGVPPGRRADPHIAFFLARNPGHARGDELVCLTEIAEPNLTAAGWRMVANPSR